MLPTFRNPRAGAAQRGPYALQVQHFLALSAPFLIVFFSDLVIGRRDYDMFASESLGHFFGTGVGLLQSGGRELARYMSHNPGIPLTELSAVYHAIAGLPENDFSGFRTFAVIVNIIVVLVAAMWGAALSSKLNIDFVSLLASSSLVALMPAVITWSPSFCGYSTYGVLLLPTSIGIYSIAEADTPNRSMKATYPALGFLLSIQYLAGIVCLAFALAWASGAGGSLKKVFSRVWEVREGTRPSRLVIGAFCLTVFVAAMTAARAARKVVPTSLAPDDPLTWALCAAVAIAATTLALRSCHVRSVLTRGVGMGLVGWMIGVNIFAVEWPMALLRNVATTGGAPRPASTLAEAVQLLDLSGFLLAWPWHILIPSLWIVGVYALWRSRTGEFSTRDRFVGVFIVAVVAINFGAAWKISLIDGTERCFQCDRYYNSLIVVIPMALIWLARISSAISRVAIGVTFLAAALSLHDYATVVIPVTRENWRVNVEATALVEEHLEKTDGKVFCSDSYLPDACNVATAFWMLYLRQPAGAQDLGEHRRVRSLHQTWEGVDPDSMLIDNEHQSGAPALLFLGRPAGEASSQSLQRLLANRESVTLLHWAKPNMQHRISPPAYFRAVRLETPVTE